VVSSYIPSISTLLEQNAAPQSQGNINGLLAISQPKTPGQHPLPGTVTEVKAIQPLVESNISWLNDSQATTKTVLGAMEKYSWIHLACHGTQRKDDPLQSAFMLHDGPLSLQTISQKTLLHAKLAFLSACQTATGDENLPEESAHLAAGMLMIGYRTVIGTMWSIKDAHGPIVAEEFYKAMVRENMKTEEGQAAYALHGAVERLRNQVGENDYFSWIPFIHLGV
jgi:CHAT domain-containing protein